MRKGLQSFSLLAATFMGTMNRNAVVPVIALYSADLGAGIGLVGLIVALYSIVHIPANVVFRRLADEMTQEPFHSPRLPL